MSEGNEPLVGLYGDGGTATQGRTASVGAPALDRTIRKLQQLTDSGDGVRFRVKVKNRNPFGF